MSSQGNDRQPAGNQIQPGGQELDEHQPDQGLPEDPQDWQDLGPFDELEEHGGQTGRKAPPSHRQPR